MRVVGGEFRGRPLASPKGDTIRPTSDRLRQTVFDILAHAYGDPARGGRILDLFAGTGALGIEAMSRGGDFVLFVEEGLEARGLIRANMEALGLTGRSRVFRRDATALGPIGNVAPFGPSSPTRRTVAGWARRRWRAPSPAGGWRPGPSRCWRRRRAWRWLPLPGSMSSRRGTGDSQVTFFRALP